MANKYTKMAEKERMAKAEEIIRRRTAAEAEVAQYARERGEAERKARAAKKVVAECMAELAELATA